MVQFEKEHSVAICDEKMIVKSGETVEVSMGNKKYLATIEAEGKVIKIHILYACSYVCLFLPGTLKEMECMENLYLMEGM